MKLAADLDVELEVALLRALQSAWHDLNGTHFRRKLQPPQLVLSDAESRLGLWRKHDRTLELGRRFVLDASWGEVIEVLKHEMAHQYVSEVLGDPDETANGAAFREVCERLAIDARAAGRPHATDTANADELRILARIGKLLALAGSANQHEAELAMAEAQRLMLAHNLAAAAMGHRYRFVHLGRPTGRISEAERGLANLLGEHFFVEVIWVPVWRAHEGKRGSVLEVCGSDVNLEMASYVYDFLLRTADRLWDEYRRQKRLSSQRERRTFIAGVIAGFKDKLDRQRAAQKEKGLVWVGDADLGKYLRRRHPRVRWTYYGSASDSTAHVDGRAAGAGVVLHRPVATNGKRTLGLLGPG